LWSGKKSAFLHRTFLTTIKTHTMGRGDKKTKKGKIFKGSFGKSRPTKPAAAKKATEKKEA
jgi:30S ribosomal protein S31